MGAPCLGKSHFWKYLQIRDCITSNARMKNAILEYFELPVDCHQAAVFFIGQQSSVLAMIV